MSEILSHLKTNEASTDDRSRGGLSILNPDLDLGNKREGKGST